MSEANDKNRLLSRFREHRLPCQSYSFSDLPVDVQQQILEAISPGAPPILAFYESGNRWTVVSDLEIVSFHGGRIYRGLLASIKPDFQLQWPAMCQSHTKELAEFISLETGQIQIWVPPGAPLFALLNTILPFLTG